MKVRMRTVAVYAWLAVRYLQLPEARATRQAGEVFCVLLAL